jgi:hypothetical protein
MGPASWLAHRNVSEMKQEAWHIKALSPHPKRHLFIYLFIYFCGAGNRTKGFEQARKTLNCQATSSFPLFSTKVIEECTF